MSHAGYRPEPTYAVEQRGVDLAPVFAGSWPEFIFHDPVVSEHIGRVREWFADLDLTVIDEHDRPVAGGWAVPIHWTGELDDLPGGYTDAMVRSVVGRENGEQPDTLVIMGAQVAEGVRGQGLAGRVLTELKNLAASRSWDKVIAPVRPTLKSSYPLVDIKRFVTWTQEDGGPLDPWLRTHWRMGARVLSCAPASQTMTGTVAEWERWTGLALPETGDYVIPEGLSVLRIDQEKDEGRYVEPNVWMRHC